MTSNIVRLSGRESSDPERVAWARMWARRCQVALKRGQSFVVIVGGVRDEQDIRYAHGG